MSSVDTVATWVILAPPAAATTTWLGGRLLGVRRSLFALTVSGTFGFAIGVVFAGAVTGWQWGTWAMGGLVLGFGTVMTMVIAVGFDLVAAPGGLVTDAPGEGGGVIRRVQASRSAIGRYRELVGIARRNGLLRIRPDLTDPVAVAQLGPPLRSTLEEAGGLFVKLGQVASTRSDLLPPALCDELATLRSNALPAPTDAVRAELEKELGTPVDTAYARFDWDPLASASIAQVYAAETFRGDQVVVKVRRPGLDRLLRRDQDALLQAAGLLERHTSLGAGLRPTEVAKEFLDGVREELDLHEELTNAQALAVATPEGSGVRVPVMHPDLSSRMVLTEERVDGPSVGDLDALRAAGHDPSELARRLLRVMLHHIFRFGVYHADPHPGNLLVEPDGTIVMIDLGAVGHLGRQQRSVIMQLMIGMAAADATVIRQGLEQAGVLAEGTNIAELEGALDGFLARHVQAGGGIDAAVFEDMMAMLRRFGLHAPRWMATLGRTFITLEGTLRVMDATFSLVDEATAEMREVIGPDLSSLSFRDAAEGEALKQLPRLRRIPGRIDDLLGQAVQGRLSVRASLFSDERDVSVITTLVNRAVLAVLAAALGLGSVLLLDGRAPGTEITVDEVLGYTGLGIASVLTLRIVAGVVREHRS
jgi:ubiquinone biosynthesis protein